MKPCKALASSTRVVNLICFLTFYTGSCSLIFSLGQTQRSFSSIFYILVNVCSSVDSFASSLLLLLKTSILPLFCKLSRFHPTNFIDLNELVINKTAPLHCDVNPVETFEISEKPLPTTDFWSRSAKATESSIILYFENTRIRFVSQNIAASWLHYRITVTQQVLMKIVEIRTHRIIVLGTIWIRWGSFQWRGQFS